MSTAEEAFPWLFTNAANAEVVAEVVDYGIPTMRESERDPVEYVTAEEAMQRLRIGPEQFRKNYVAVLDRVDTMSGGVDAPRTPWAVPGHSGTDPSSGMRQAALHLHAQAEREYRYDFESLDDLTKYSVQESEEVYPAHKDRAEVHLESQPVDWDVVPRPATDKPQPVNRRHGWIQAKRPSVTVEDADDGITGHEVWEDGYDPGLEPSRSKRKSDLPWDVDLYSWGALEYIHQCYEVRSMISHWNYEKQSRGRNGRFQKRT